MKDLVSILDGNTFVVSEGNGDIDASPASPTGLFAFDTRFLSKWVLSVNGERLSALSVDDLQYFETRFFLVPGEPTQYLNAQLSVIRQRWVGGSFEEIVTVLNHKKESIDLRIRLEAAADFADLFEIKDAIQGKVGKVSARVEDGSLRLTYQRAAFRRDVIISTSDSGHVDECGITFDIQVEPHGRWSTHVNVESVVHAAPGRPSEESLQSHARRTRRQMREALDRWLDSSPRLVCDYRQLEITYQRSLVDLHALRFVSPIGSGRSMPCAGLPWFMTLFGRDSIFTCLQAMPFKPELSVTTLRVLAGSQGAHLDDFRDEEPGKGVHEFRYGESSAFEEQPHSGYFGAADSTSLYVVLLDEYERWSGDGDLVRSLEFEARRSLNWIDRYGDLQGDGYVWYQRRNTKNGLENQCWKDSWDSISYHDGRLPNLPRATCELQGYAYDAKIRGARLAREYWNDPAYADALETQAADLKQRFNRDYWVEDGEFYALALDADGRQVDALSSNIGHLLWSGIVDESKAEKVVEHLLGPRLFSGWGVRTLATGEGRYNPVGYHVGTVWPFDNSIIAWGLSRYGFRQEAARIAAAVIEASQFFQGRLPEAIAGYKRELTKYPVEYPTACSPQAWSSGAPLLLLRTMLGLEPIGNTLTVDPVLPEIVGQIELRDVPGRWGLRDVLARG